ncbi:MAG: glycosyltransferase family 2 protein [Bacteroidota bacterium]|nr:glycosyltransferase family 2 protein [Bacteroidota bacterium]
MNEKPLLTIVMPSYNEAENLVVILPPLIELCRQRNWKTILVNDGSTDKTKEIVLPFEGNDFFVALHHKLNKGYGAAIKTGIQACDTTYVITIDADGQHNIADIEKLVTCMQRNDADMVVGSRRGTKSESVSRGIGKSIIRTIAQMLMQVPIYDINSGMKIYNSVLARKYLHLAPDTMAFSDIITLVFINNRHLVLEEPITISSRLKGKSTIGMQTAFQTVMEIVNILVLFNPMKIFLPIAVLTFTITLIWGIPLVLAGRGISTGTLLGLVSTMIFFFLGLITEQLSQIRRNQKQASGDK